MKVRRAKPRILAKPLATISLLAFALAGCGTLQLTVEQSPEPPDDSGAQTTPAVSTPPSVANTPEAAAETPSVQAGDGWPQLVGYVHPRWGYELLIPEGAGIMDDELDEKITYFTNSNQTSRSGTYLISVEIVIDPPAEAAQASDQLALWLAAGKNGDIEVEVVDIAAIDANSAQVSFSGGSGMNCAKVQFLLAAFLDRGTGYAIRIGSDFEGRCDATTLSEASAIVNSFRPPANGPVLAMTPTPTPAVAPGSPVVVYNKDNNVWLWTESDGEHQLTKDGGVAEVLLSDDATVVAFRRGNGIWAVNADGSGERQLLQESDLPVPQEGDLAELITGMRPYQLAWVPGSRQLLFNTSPEVTGPGLFLSDDLWLVDADSLSLTNLLPAGQGGNFVVAPDGRQVVVIRPDSITLTDIAGTGSRQILGYTPVLTYSEFQYYARPVWSADAESLRVVIPPPDPLAMEQQLYGIWHLSTDGTPARLIGSVEARARQQEPVIAPGLDQIAYLNAPEIDPERTDLMLRTLGDVMGEPTFYASHVDTFGSWSPGGEQFSFTRLGEQSINYFTGRLGEEARALGESRQPVIDVRWIDDERFVFLQASARGWDLFLAGAGGETTFITGIVGPPPAFDVGS